MFAILVLAGVGAIAASAAIALAVLAIGIHKAERRRLSSIAESHSEALARRLLLSVPRPAQSPEIAGKETETGK